MYVRFARKIIPREKNLGYKRLDNVLKQLHRLLTVSDKASFLCGPFNIGSTKSLLFWAIGQKARLILVTCRNSALMAGSQYPQTTRSLLKTGLLLNNYIIIVLFSRLKSSSPAEDQPFPSTPSFPYTESEFGVS